MLFGWSLGWLIANGWSLDRHRLCGNPALLRIRLVVLFAALVGLLDGWSVGCLWLFGWLLMVVCLLDCWLVANGWSLESLISCVDNGNLPFLVDRIKLG